MSSQRDHTFLQNFARRFSKPAPMHVVFIDPDQENARRLLGALRSPYTTTSSASAREAFTTFETKRPTLLVTELDLPDGSGIDLLRSLHASAAYRHVLLMVITARHSVGDKIAAFQAGADDYLVKPVDPQAFAEHVERLSRFRQVVLTDA